MAREQDIRLLEQQIRKQLERGNSKAAIQLCQQLNQAKPLHAPGWYLTSQTAMRLNNPKAALAAIGKALELDPEDPAWLLQKGLCLSGLSRMTELVELVDQLTTLDIDTTYQCSTMGSLLCQVHRHAEAVPFYEKAVTNKPNDAQHAYNLACLYRSIGRLEDAERCFDKAIELAPKDYESYKLRSELRKQKPNDNHVATLTNLLESGSPDPRGQVQLHYALAKELEDLGEPEKAFKQLKQGADLRRSLMQYSVERDIETMEAIKQHFNNPMFTNPPQGDDSKEPIFILGMPRTGTTLVERILSGHSEVYSAGELNNFSIQMMEQVKEHKPKDRNALVEATTKLDFKQLGKAYVESTRPFTGKLPRFIDKMPLNYLYAGLIHLALPNAKIISLTRHPMDTCYSVYKQLFMDAYPFSYDLEELAKYYVGYHQLMQHWDEVMPGTICRVSYEDLVADIEGTTRTLLEFCELDWQEECLDFTSNAQASTTASASQVRQPLYSSSLGRWKDYREELEPLAGSLRAKGIDCG